MPEEALHDAAFTLMCYLGFGVWTVVLIAAGIGALLTAPRRVRHASPPAATPYAPYAPSQRAVRRARSPQIGGERGSLLRAKSHCVEGNGGD